MLMVVGIFAIAVASACHSDSTVTGGIPVVDAASLDAELSALVEEHGVNTAGVAVIRNGKIAWTGYYGNQAPGVMASSETMFNVASVTKVVTAETILRLAGAGKLSLDKSMAPYWVDPDIADDPRHKQLTPRIALNHTTGLPNWRFLLPDRKLKFLHDPGTTYGYSGEGYEYLATYAGKKLDRDFGELVHETVLEPIGISGAAYTIREETFDKLAQARGEDGEFNGHYCRPNGWCREPGTYSAADDMAITVEDYARFMIAVMNADGYSDDVERDRNRVQSDKADQAVVLCDQVTEKLCPEKQGYGLGWQVLDYGNYKILTHGGSDWSELALTYFYTESKDGLVIFFNAPTIRGLAAMPDAIAAIDPDSPMKNLYERWHAKASKQ